MEITLREKVGVLLRETPEQKDHSLPDRKGSHKRLPLRIGRSKRCPYAF